jgi:hypothetical protein
MHLLMTGKEQSSKFLIHGQEWGTFFRQRGVAENVQKVTPKRNAKGECHSKQNNVPIIHIKGSVMKHPCWTTRWETTSKGDRVEPM